MRAKISKNPKSFWFNFVQENGFSWTVQLHKVLLYPISTRRYLDIDSTFFGRYECQMDVKTTLCAHWVSTYPGSYLRIALQLDFHKSKIVDRGMPFVFIFGFDVIPILFRGVFWLRFGDILLSDCWNDTLFESDIQKVFCSCSLWIFMT